MNDQIRKIKRSTIRCYIVLSAGSPRSGIQGLWCTTRKNSWEFSAHVHLPYPRPLLDIMENEQQDNTALAANRLLKKKTTELFLEAVKSLSAMVPKSAGQPHFIALENQALWRLTSLVKPQARFEPGDPALLADHLNLPVISGFLSAGLSHANRSELPLEAGTLVLLNRTTGTQAIVNIGTVLRMVVRGKDHSWPLFNEDIGPCTCLLNRAAREAGCVDGFDRDGSAAKNGNPDPQALEMLAATILALPFTGNPEELPGCTALYTSGPFCDLSPVDKLATLSALPARLVQLSLRTLGEQGHRPDTIWLAGGGAHNTTITDFFRIYFDPIPVKLIDELGVAAADVYVPAALALTIHQWLSGKPVLLQDGKIKKQDQLGYWNFPNRAPSTD